MVMPGSGTPSLLAAEGDNANCLLDQVQPALTSGASVWGSMKLPHYNGEEPPETYLIQVQLAAQLNGWSTEETAVQVALALEVRALQILTDLQPEERLSWRTVARAMQSRFGLCTHADDAQDELASRPQRQEESLGAYYLRLYAQSGYPAFDAAAQEELALQAFVRGLQPKRLQEHIRLHAPETLAAALRQKEWSMCSAQVHAALAQVTECIKWTTKGATRRRPSKPPSHHPGDLGEGIDEQVANPQLPSMQRTRPHCTLLSSTEPTKPGTPPAVKLRWGGTMEELPPTTNLSSESHWRVGRLGQTRGLYLDCDLASTTCRALIDTGSTLFLGTGWSPPSLPLFHPASGRLRACRCWRWKGPPLHQQYSNCPQRPSKLYTRDALSRRPCDEEQCRYCQHLEDWEGMTSVIASPQGGHENDSVLGGHYSSLQVQFAAGDTEGLEAMEPQQLQHDQNQDHVLSQVQCWIGAGQRPSWPEVSALDLETKALYSQWANLTSWNSLLYRRWQAPGSHREPLCPVAMDYFTKWPEAYAFPDQNAVTTAERLVNEMFCRFGVPEKLHSNQGRNFEAAVFKEWTWCSDPPAEQEVRGDPGLDYLHNILARLREVQQLTRQALRDAGSRQKQAYDTRCKGEGLSQGQHVWVHSPERKKGLSPKLMSQWVRPCTVLERLSDVVYRVRLVKRNRVVVLHCDCLAPYQPLGPPREESGSQLQLQAPNLASETAGGPMERPQ
ncbi:unnamed protein product [Oreochromis niloticus]|nr:unnamed protein product [Mustela putorius furo]